MRWRQEEEKHIEETEEKDNMQGNLYDNGMKRIKKIKKRNGI